MVNQKENVFYHEGMKPAGAGALNFLVESSAIATQCLKSTYNHTLHDPYLLHGEPKRKCFFTMKV